MSFRRDVRFQEFLQRLEAADAVASNSEALALIARVLVAVEDEMTDIPNNAASWQTDGRMYPPQSDNVRDVQNRADLVRFRSRGHNTLIRDNGAIEIRDLRGNVLFHKSGKDGKGVEYEQD